MYLEPQPKFAKFAVQGGGRTFCPAQGIIHFSLCANIIIFNFIFSLWHVLYVQN